MKITILSHPARRAAFFVFALIMVCSGVLRAQYPTGKWYPCTPLQTINSSGQTAHLVFADSLIGYYIGVDTGWVTKDGGQSWKMIDFGSNHSAPRYLVAPDRNTVISYQLSIVSDSDGTAFPGIIKSIDRGTTWTLVSGPSSKFPSTVAIFTMWSANDGFRICLDDISSQPVIAATHDGGITWGDLRGDATLKKYIKLTGAGKLILHDTWSDSLHGAISVSSSSTSSTTAYPVLITSDGGRTWTETYPKLNGDATIPHTYAYAFPKSQNYWVLPSILTQKSQYFYYTTNYGTDWNNTTPLTSGQLGAQTKPALVQLAPVSPTETWALIASDNTHPDLTRFIGYYDQAVGWKRAVDIKFGATGGQFGWGLVDNGLFFFDREHGWAQAEQSYFDNVIQNQIVKDTVFLFSFRTSPPVKGQGAVKENTNTVSLLCTPNPASSKIKVSGFTSNEQVREIKIANMLGKESSYVPKISGSEIELDLSNLPSGSYYVNVKTSLRQESIPVMVVR